MDNLLINLIGMGKQGGTTGNTSLKESSGVGSSQKGFLNILTNIISEGNGHISLLSKLKEMQESGESGLACVMSSISNILLSIIPPETLNAGPEVPGHVISEISEDRTEQEGLAKAGIQKETKDLRSWLEQINYSALQEILTNTRSQKTDEASTDKAPTVIALENGTEGEAEQVKEFQEEMIKLLSYLNGKSELLIDDNKTSFQDKLGMMPVQNTDVINFQQTTHDIESKAIQGPNTMSASGLPTKEILENNAAVFHVILKNEEKVNRDDNNKIGNTFENKGTDGLFKTDEKIGQNIVKQSFTTDQGFDERGGDKAKGETNTLVFNATKKYKEHISEANELKTTIDGELTNVFPQKSTIEVPQSESFKANILQVRDNNMTFEKGSFTSFVTDRIEKIVEQFSGRGSQMDMVVRLKLDDKETLLVGLKYEGQKIIVDVKASNDGLVNLIQTHKDDIARHLEDKNIFTSIFVQPDGEKNAERQNQREGKKENKKQEAKASFINILEATA